MSLISRSDLIKVSGLSRIGFLKNPVASAIMSLTKIDEVNKLYDVIKDKKGKDFFDYFQILIPDNIKEQQKISEILSIVDDQIEQTGQLIEKTKYLKNMTQIFFVHSDIALDTAIYHSKYKSHSAITWTLNAA